MLPFTIQISENATNVSNTMWKSECKLVEFQRLLGELPGWGSHWILLNAYQVYAAAEEQSVREYAAVEEPSVLQPSNSGS